MAPMALRDKKALIELICMMLQKSSSGKADCQAITNNYMVLLFEHLSQIVFLFVPPPKFIENL